MTDSDISIRKAEIQDLTAIKQLADENTIALGFVLRPALVAGIERGWLLVAERSNNEDVVGFVHYRHRRDSQTTLYEICVQQHHRRQGIGIALISALSAEASAFGKTHVRLKAPADIAANDFYQAVGFALAGMEPGRKRNLNIWNYVLPDRESVR